ncbi:BamA/TamA family outer membrane protein [Candidatus Fermentibacteria bacterium]|nr:BamA/TamA family outer membrane protein [Candidatus Fermentibacteria bacterium]
MRIWLGLVIVLWTAGAQGTAPDASPGSLQTIDSISVTGAEWISRDDILDGTNLEIGRSVFEITRMDVYGRVLANLQGMGYLDASVEVGWPAWSSDTSLVSISIAPGRRSLRGGLVFEGNTVIPSSRLRREFAVESGETITPALLDETKENILGAYGRHGYVTAAVELRMLPFEQPGPDSVPGIRGVECIVSEGPQIRFGSIRIEGLETVRRKVVEREIRLARGDSLDTEILRRSISSIYGLGLFQDVRFSYSGLEEGRDTVDLLIQVTERAYRQLDLGAGYGSPSALLLSAFWKHPNILDNNQRLVVGASYTRYLGEAGGDEIEPEISYEEPWIASTRWNGRIRAGYLYLQLPALSERRYGAEITISRDLTEHLRLTLGYALERDRFTSSTPEGWIVESDWTTTSSLTGSMAHDTRDAVLDPAVGHLLRGEGRLSGGVLGGLDYYRIEGEARIFKPIIRDVILAWRVRAGSAFPYGDDGAVPPNDRFYLGGGSTVRGFGFNQLGPEDDEGNPIGGRIMLLGNIESRMRIWHRLGVALFLDLGGLWESVGEIAAGSTGFGAGMGIRLGTPFGPLRIDYGFAPTWTDGLRRGRVYFALGHPF